MMKASVKGKYDTEKSVGGGAGTLVLNGGDVRLRASITDATLNSGPSLNGLSLSLEKPGSFIIDYNVPKKDVRFQFMNSVKVLDKAVNLTYSHARGDNRTAVDGTLILDSSNKISANYALDSGNCKLKYSYIHKGLTTFEPSYDTAKNTWDFAMSQKIYDDDVVRASYQSSSKVLGVDWLRNSRSTGSFKISATMNLAEELKLPKITAESTWDIEM
jgi:hypothetical protein